MPGFGVARDLKKKITSVPVMELPLPSSSRCSHGRCPGWDFCMAQGCHGGSRWVVAFCKIPLPRLLVLGGGGGCGDYALQGLLKTCPNLQEMRSDATYGGPGRCLVGPCLSFPACTSVAHPAPETPGMELEGFSSQQTVSGMSHRARAHPCGHKPVPKHPCPCCHHCPWEEGQEPSRAPPPHPHSPVLDSAPTWGTHPEHPLPETPKASPPGARTHAKPHNTETFITWPVRLNYLPLEE